MAEPAYGSLPFSEQIAFFRRKLNLPTRAWTDIWTAEHDWAFVVAGANRDAIVADFRAAVEKAIADGTTLEAFRNEFDAIVAKHGWDYNGGRDWRSRVIYETNLNTSYAAGRYEQLQAAPYWQDGVLGEPLRPFGWITHVHKAKSGYLERAALFRQLVWTYLFKNYSVGDLAEFLEIYGIPLRVGKYHSGASEAEKTTLLRALSSIGRNAAGIVPESMMLEFHDAADGDPKAFELMMSWCERNQSKVILGATLTSGADGAASTNALGQIHNEVRKDLRDSDLRQIGTTLTRDLVYAVAALNGLAPEGPRRAPVFQLNAQEREDLTAYAEALPRLVAIGLRPTVKWAHEQLGIPQPEAGEAVLGAPALPTLGAAFGQQPGRAAFAAQSPADTPPPMLQAALLAAGAAPAVDGWLDQVRALVAKAESLQDIRDGLEALLPDMTLDQYAAAMGQALAAAQLAGRYQVLQEAGGIGG